MNTPRALRRWTGPLSSAACLSAVLLVSIAGTAMGAHRVQPADKPAPAEPPAEPEMPDLEKLKEMIKAKLAEQAGKGQPGDTKEAQGPSEKPAVNAKSAAEVQSEEAVARFQQLLARRPFHGPAFAALANHYAERGKLKDLIAEYTAKVAALPDDPSPRIILARLQLREGDGPGAAATLAKIGTLPPDLARQSGELLVLKADVFQKTGDNASAEKVLKEAVAGAQGGTEKLRLTEALADLYVRTGRKDDAASALNGLAGELGDNFVQQKHLAAALAQRELHDAAVARYKAIAATVKDDAERRTEVLRDMGSSLEKLGKKDEAIAAYIEAVGLLSSEHWMVPELHERIVGLYRAQNKLEELAAYCKMQITKAPEQVAVRVLLADVQAALGKPDEGKKVYEEAVAQFPKDAGLSQKRVEFLERVGDAEGVAAEYQRAIGQRGDDSELYIAYGQFLANNKKLEGAKSQWQHVLETRLSDAALAVRLGSLFEAYEMTDDAANAYERAIAVAPKQPDGYLSLSRLYVTKGDADKAVATLVRMGDAGPTDGALQAAKAQGLRGLGRIDEALEAATKASELLPDDTRLMQARAELLVQAGKLEDALGVRRAMLDKITNPVQQAEAIGTLVSMHASADRLPALREAEEKRLAAKPGDVVSLLLLARVGDAERDFGAARKNLEALLKADPANEAGLSQMAKLQDATGDMDGAVETYTRLAQRYPARARSFYESIVELRLRYGDRANAISTLEKMAQNDAASAPTQSAVGDQLTRMGEAERALPYFEKALAIQADRYETRLEYGKALIEAGRLEDAMEAFRAVASQRTDTDRAADGLGKLRDTAVQLGRLEELMDELHRQVEADPRNTMVARTLAQLLVGEMEYGRALELLDLVQRHNPRNAEVGLGRAEVLRRLARYDDAVDAYERVLRLPQIDRDYVLGEMGKAYFESGRVDQARRLWKQIQNKLYAGSLLKNNGILEEAVLAFEEGIRLKPDEYALHRNLIEALETAGRQPEALAAARRLLDLDPGNVWNVERLAEAHLRANDRKNAAAVAGRMFSSSVGADKVGGQAGGSSGYASGGYSAYGGYSSYGGYGYGGGGKTNLEKGVQFFLGHGLKSELEEVLEQQLKAQPDNAILTQTAAGLYTEQLNKPERAIELYRALETAKFPVEHQHWLGQCSQQEYMRLLQYQLISTKPALRNKQLAAIEAKKVDELSRDELILLAMMRAAQGNNDKATELLTRAVAADEKDTLALSSLVGLLVAAEKFKEAEGPTRKLTAVLAERRDKMRDEMVERVRRDFVRTLPVELQLRVNEQLLKDLADKWTLGSGWSGYEEGGGSGSMGYMRARLTLATICAETERMDEAKTIWQELAPGKQTPDVDRLTMLGDTAQLHKQDDLAFDFYKRAMAAAKQAAADPLLQRVYGGGSNTWYGEDATVDKGFNGIVKSFSDKQQLPELYDFLRDTNQSGKARRLFEEYKLGDGLKTTYQKRVTEAAAAFKASPEGPMRASPAYFAELCKLAEVYDLGGDWASAQAAYESYLKDFPDELGLLTMLGEVAEARLKTDEAIEWEKKVLECKGRLAKQARAWSQRELVVTPAVPQAMGDRTNAWDWASRWGSSRYYGYGYGSSGRDQLERWPSLMRLAQLQLAAKNPVAAADSMQRAVAESGPRRDDVVRQTLMLIEQRQLTGQMLPVLRTLAVYAPADERVQLAFARSLEENNRKELALEVCNRLLRKGVSDLAVLGELRRRVQTLNPGAAPAEATIPSLEAQVASDSGNFKARLRLAKAYYYSLALPKAEAALAALAKDSPNMEDVHDLLVEVYTLTDNSEKLTEALRKQIERTTDERKRRQTKWRLVDQLLAAGKTDEALTMVKDLGDPRDPYSYTRIGAMLHYFGKPDDAQAALEQASKSGQGSRGGGYGGYEGLPAFTAAQSLAMRGEYAKAAEKLLAAIDEEAAKQTQYGGMGGMAGDRGERSAFVMAEPVFALYPKLADEVKDRVMQRYKAQANDVQAAKLLMALHKSLGRPDLADAVLEDLVKDETADQGLVADRIDLAVRRREFDRAIDLATKFIAQAPKPQLPPGMPAQYAGYAVLQSPRTMMICKLGDVYWAKGDKAKAFELYGQIVDKKIDETKTAYAGICLMRGRVDEAKTLVDEALAAQQVKPVNLQNFKAYLLVLDGKITEALDVLEAAAATAGPDRGERFAYDGGGSPSGGFAALAQRAGMVDRAAAFLEGQIKKHPEDWTNYQSLANLYWQNGRPQEALAVIDRAAASPPMLQQSLQTKLSYTQSTAKPDDLIPLYEKLIELTEREARPSGRASQYGYGGGYGYEEYGGAGQTYRETLANLLWEKGEKEKADKLWTERMNMQLSASHARLGAVYAARQEFDKAKAAYAKAVELDPENVSARSALASELYVRGELKEMLPHMLEVFLRRPSGEDDQSRYGYRQQYGEQDAGGGAVSRMTEWAIALSNDPALSTYLASPELAGREAEAKIMLSSLTGDWATLESVLKQRIDAGSVDPTDWRLWARTQQRKGAWAEAAKALDFLRRVRLTSINDHRDKLKLVLAGQQLKEASAGTRQAPTAAGGVVQGQGSQGSSGYYGGSYGGYYGGYYGDYSGWWDGSGTQLPSICIKLGDFKRAERLYLLSSGGDGIESKLPYLASLMWEQGAKDRALELMRLSLALSSNNRYSRGSSSLTQYALMLAEAGKADEARDLLVRAYRWSSSGADDGSSYAYRYGYSYQNQSLERGEEEPVSRAIYWTMVRDGSVEKGMADLADRLAKDPGDPQMSKLLISLQKRQRQWEAMRDGLNKRAEALKHNDSAVTSERLAAAYQLGAWDDALKLIAQRREESPEQSASLAAEEAFVHLMRNDGEKAVAALKPIMDAPEGDAQATTAAWYWTELLAVTGKYDQMCSHLEAQRKAGQLDEGGTELLARALAEQKKFDEAFALTTEQLWRSQAALRPANRWWRTASYVVARAQSQGAKVSPAAGRGADAALLAMAVNGPAEGVKAFTELCSQPTADVNSLRGLIFALMCAGDDKGALAANTRLLETLRPKRNSAWFTEPSPSLQSAARAMVSQNGYGAMAMAGYGAQMEQLVSQLGDRYDRQTERVATYARLVQAHESVQRRLTALCEDTDKLTAAVKAESTSRQYGYGYGDDSYRQYQYYQRYSSGRYGSSYGYNQYGDDPDAQTPAGDVPTQVRSALRQAGKMTALDTVYASLGSRTPSSEWSTRANAAAAAGKAADAAALRLKLAESRLASLAASDTPTITSGASRWAWYSYGYDSGSTELNTLRWALKAPTVSQSDEEQVFTGTPDQLWELALVEPSVEQKLLALEGQIGPGWDSTRTLEQLLQYYRAKKQPAKVFELVEKTGKPEQFMLSRAVAHYVWACYKAKDTARLNALLDLAAKSDATLRNELDCARLVMMRLNGNKTEADALESKLLAVTTREPRNKMRIAPGLVPEMQFGNDPDSGSYSQQYYGRSSSSWQYQQQYQYGYGYANDQARLTQPQMLSQLAYAFGVRLEPNQRPGGLTEGTLWSMYSGQGLYADAIRLLDAQAAEAAVPSDRWSTLEWKAFLQEKAGDKAGALKTVTDLSKELEGEMAKSPTSATAMTMARIWAGKAGGKDHAKALAAMETARRLDPAADRASALAVHCLYESGNYKQAWEAWKTAAISGMTEPYSERMLHQGAQSALAAGDKETGKVLARLALFQYPVCPLAAKTRELIHD